MYKSQNWPFSHLYSIYLYCEDVKMFRNFNFGHENMKNPPSKVGYFSKIAQIISSDKNGPFCLDC